MAAINFTVNGQRQSVDVPPQMPLLWVLRDTLGLTGTKFGCGMGLCGACTVHIDGQALRSCSTQISASQERRSPPSKDCRPTERTPCSRHGLKWTSRSADTASPDRS